MNIETATASELRAAYARVVAVTVFDIDPLRVLPETFTLADARRVHVALGNDMQRDTFNRVAVRHLVPTDEFVASGGRPARLYRRRDA